MSDDINVKKMIIWAYVPNKDKSKPKNSVHVEFLKIDKETGNIVLDVSDLNAIEFTPKEAEEFIRGPGKNIPFALQTQGIK